MIRPCCTVGLVDCRRVPSENSEDELSLLMEEPITNTLLANGCQVAEHGRRGRRENRLLVDLHSDAGSSRLCPV